MRARRPLIARVLTGMLVFSLGLAMPTGCASRAHPIDPATAPDGEVLVIAMAFEETVERIHADPGTRWHSGWTGNLAVHTLGWRHRGLCHHWRDAVYEGVAPTVRGLGWDAIFLYVNWGDAGEHSAVLVYDADAAHAWPSLDDPPESGAYVLDAWRRGRADVYTLRGWLSNQHHVTRAPELFDPEP